MKRNKMTSIENKSERVCFGVCFSVHDIDLQWLWNIVSCVNSFYRYPMQYNVCLEIFYQENIRKSIRIEKYIETDVR